MAIAVDATGTVQNFTSGTSASYTGITVGSGSNRALLIFVRWTIAITSPSATWDNGGTNQAMTLLESSSPIKSAIFGVINPTAGNKTCLVSWTTSTVSNVEGQSYTGVLQTGGSTTWPNPASNTGSSTTPSVTVTSAVGNLPVALHATVSTTTFASVDHTQIFLTNTAPTGAANSGAGASSITFGAVINTTGSWVSIGVDMVAAALNPIFGFDGSDLVASVNRRVMVPYH